MLDVGIAEGHLITSAAGLAAAGFIPFTHCYGIFGLGRAYNQIRHNVAYDERNVKIVFSHCGVIWGNLGPSHQVVEDIAALRAVPKLIILSPADAVSAEKATYAAAEHVGPVVLRLPTIGEAHTTIYTSDLDYRIGKAICLRDGKDATILATGILVGDALTVAEEMEQTGVSVRVLDVHTIKPLDDEAVIDAARETGALIAVEDASILGGLGAAVAEVTLPPIGCVWSGVMWVWADSVAMAPEIVCVWDVPPETVQVWAIDTHSRHDSVPPGVHQEDRAALSANAWRSMPEHYASADVRRMMDLANRVLDRSAETVTILRVANGGDPSPRQRAALSLCG